MWLQLLAAEQPRNPVLAGQFHSESVAKQTAKLQSKRNPQRSEAQQQQQAFGVGHEWSHTVTAPEAEAHDNQAVQKKKHRRSHDLSLIHI